MLINNITNETQKIIKVIPICAENIESIIDIIKNWESIQMDDDLI